jgi:hypothetical protein
MGIGVKTVFWDDLVRRVGSCRFKTEGRIA